jgi:hypothetical protein
MLQKKINGQLPDAAFGHCETQSHTAFQFGWRKGRLELLQLLSCLSQ